MDAKASSDGCFALTASLIAKGQTRVDTMTCLLKLSANCIAPAQQSSKLL